MAGLEKKSLEEQLGTQRLSTKGQGSVLAVPSASKLSLRGQKDCQRESKCSTNSKGIGVFSFTMTLPFKDFILL